MVNYATWPNIQNNTSELLLDQFNPRIPFNLQGKLNQDKILHYLSDHEDVVEIADNIANIGYFSFEPLIGIIENDKVIIVEGNRRLSACKFLLQPDLAPEKKRKHYKKLSSLVDLDTIKKLYILIAPSRESASNLIANRHINILQKGWKTVMQAHYFHSLLSQTNTISSLAIQLNMTESEVKKEIQSFNVFLYIQNLDFEEALKSDVSDAANFPLSTLRRVYENSSHARKFLNLGFDIDGQINKKVNDIGLIQVVSDILCGEIDSRSLNKSSDIKSYIETIQTEMGAPDNKKTKKEKKKKGTKRKAKKEEESNTLIPEDFQVVPSNQRVKNVLDELKRIDYMDLPNASAVTLRCLLEISIYNFLDKEGVIKQMKKEMVLKRNSEGKSFDVTRYPQLKDMMIRLGEKSKSPITDSHILKSVQGFNKEEHLETLNLVIHNHHYYPTPQRIKIIANNLLGLFGFILK